MRMRYSELPRYYRENVKHVNVAMFQVCADGQPRLLQLRPQRVPPEGSVRARPTIVIVEVNKNMPRCLGGFGGQRSTSSEVDMVVER